MTNNEITIDGAITALRTLAQDARMLHWEADKHLLFAADELERLRALEAPKPQGRTVRVRIACGILPDGSWYAAGASTMKDAMSIVKVFAGQSGFAHWVVADLPLPTEHTEVRGRVE